MIVILFMVVAAATAEKLQSNYLPPTSAYSSGGSSNFLSLPRQTFSDAPSGPTFGQSSRYLPPSSQSFGNRGSFSSVPRQTFSGLSANPSGQSSRYLPPTSQSFGSQGSFSSVPRQTFSGFSANSGSAFTHSGIATSYAAPPSGPVTSGLYNSPTRTYSTGIPVAILRFDNENNGDGNYRFEYQTENKISQQEQGHVQNAGTDQATTIVHGTYSYEAPDGQTITVTYTADENGFRAAGDHIPTPPPIPAAIQKSLEISSLGSRTTGYSSSASFSSGVSSSSFGNSLHQPHVNRQYLAPSSQTSGGYQY